MAICHFVGWSVVTKLFRDFQSTERDELQCEEGLKSLAPPPTAQTTGAIGLIFGLGALQGHRTGVTIAIFEFPSGTPKNRPPRAHWGWGPQNLGGQFLGVPDGRMQDRD